MAVDTIGSWLIEFRRYRGGSAEQKRSGLLFNCLVTHLINQEIIEQITSSSFINALERSVTLNGPVTQFPSDCGTNFLGVTEDFSIKQNSPV